MSEWKRCTVGDVCEVFDGPHATPPQSNDGPIYLGIPSIRSDGSIDYENSKRISYENYPKWTKRVTPQENDVVFSYEANLESYARIPAGFEGCLGRRMAIMRPDPSAIDARFLYYYTQSPAWKAVIASRTVLGATVNRIPIATFPEFPLRLPSLPAQQHIAGVLSAYDKLIENNRRQIKLLEEAAQRLYKEWFVDLRFPGHETTPIHNGIPEGWKRTTVGKICELIRDSSRPDDRNESTMYIGLEHMPKNSICLNMYGDASSVTGSKLNFRKNDILFGKIRPYFHKVGFAQCNGVTSTDTLVMRAKPNCFGLLLEIVSSDAYVAYATATSKTGTKMPRADWNAMSAYELLEPSARVLAQFDGFVKQITDEIMNLSDQIVAAREARDRLLPKLMSGEIEV
ncbi:restriction endonuclease subunit S [Ellagibacter isourolithinifaciens]|uniref:restriction endonuclease subunit S n=1 Tax=Ellagibacter isourolithinifaciens TaxID=2137581 RepID=UPI003A95DDB0